MNSYTQLAIVGAGPAGMEAAMIAAEAGVEVTVIDRFSLPGGQYFKQSPLSKHNSAQPKIIRHFDAAQVQFLKDTTTWGIFPSEKGKGWLLGLEQNGKPYWLDAEILILACGAYDRPYPFPGWTLPGVIMAGAAQIMIKAQGIRPGQRVLLSGSGPLLFAVAANLVRAGTEVVAVLQTPIPFGNATKKSSALWGQWRRIWEGAQIGFAFTNAWTPIRWGWSVTAAHGDTEVQSATIAKLDKKWQPIPETQETLAVDTIITSYGLLPNNHLGRMLNYTQNYRPNLGGWVPTRDQNLQSSLENIYIVGDMAGIRGAEAAQLEGRLAGIAVARKLDLLSESQYQRQFIRLKRQLKRQEEFSTYLGEIFNPLEKSLTLVTSDTIICRCEELTYKEINQAIQNDICSMQAIKQNTRAGMGNCQGRNCEHLIQNLLQQITNFREYPKQWSIRPPIYPLPISFLADADPS